MKVRSQGIWREARGESKYYDPSRYPEARQQTSIAAEEKQEIKEIKRDHNFRLLLQVIIFIIIGKYTNIYSFYPFDTKHTL